MAQYHQGEEKAKRRDRLLQPTFLLKHIICERSRIKAKLLINRFIMFVTCTFIIFLFQITLDPLDCYRLLDRTPERSLEIY